MVDNGADFVMEITPKSRTDIQGGTLVDYDGHIQLLELDQVPFDHVEDFKSVKKFNIFNTNNLWINLRGGSYRRESCCSIIHDFRYSFEGDHG